MSIVQSLRTLFGSRRDKINIIFGPEEMPHVGAMSARELYATQANLHAVVSFLADSVAQLPLKVYTRKGETNRTRDRSSEAALLLYRPNADQTCYEFVYALLVEFLLMGVSTVWLLPDPDSPSGKQLRLIPREWIMESNAETNYAPDVLKVQAMNGYGSFIEIPRSEFVQFRYYSPGNPAGFQAPIASLRQTLMEQVQADKFRTAVWKSGGRFNAYITRPKDVQPWDEGQRERWVKAFREAWGDGGVNAGKMPLLEDGMEIKPYQFNSKEAQYAETKQLSREDVAAAYHINPNLIWNTGTKTYASAKDNARALYSDCLGPILQMLQQRINAFLLPMIGADPETYVEFDLTEKLKGSFEERASILQSSVGGPWLTRNEARADNNLPPIDGGDELIVPLNVVAGGQASPQDTHMDGKAKQRIVDEFVKQIQKKASEIRIKGRSDEEEDAAVEKVLQKFFKRQADSVLPKLGAKAASWWDKERWDKELAADLEPVMDTICDAHGKAASRDLGSDYDTGITRNYLKAMALGRAKATNAVTYDKLKRAKDKYDPEDEESASPADVMEKRAETEAPMLGRSLATAVAGWAVLEACQQARRGNFTRMIEKEWHTGSNPRASHAAMDGERVPFDSNFSNGAKWPGDDAIGPDETCNCNCWTEVVITEV